MDYVALKSEIVTDPLVQGYAGKTPAQIVVLLNTPKFTMAKGRFVTARTVLSEVAGGAALLDKLQAIGATVSAVKYAMTFLNQDSGIDIGNFATQAMVDQLVTGAALTAAEGADLKGLATKPASRAEVLGFGTVADADYTRAFFNDNGSAK